MLTTIVCVVIYAVIGLLIAGSTFNRQNGRVGTAGPGIFLFAHLIAWPLVLFLRRQVSKPDYFSGGR